MDFRIKKKVKEGKVVKIEFDCNDVIRNIRITGDFFLHPENMLEEIEKSIVGLDRNADENTIISNIQKGIAVSDAQMIGISPESIARLIKEALG